MNIFPSCLIPVAFRGIRLWRNPFYLQRMCTKKYLAPLSSSPIQKEHKEIHFDELVWWKGVAISYKHTEYHFHKVKRELVLICSKMLVTKNLNHFWNRIWALLRNNTFVSQFHWKGNHLLTSYFYIFTASHVLLCYGMFLTVLPWDN